METCFWHGMKNIKDTNFKSHNLDCFPYNSEKDIEILNHLYVWYKLKGWNVRYVYLQLKVTGRKKKSEKSLYNFFFFQNCEDKSLNFEIKNPVAETNFHWFVFRECLEMIFQFASWVSFFILSINLTKFYVWIK